MARLLRTKTTIICTLGPVSSAPCVIRQMASCGMRIARLNFSHGNHEQHAARIAAIKSIRRRYRYPIAILQDLEGYRIRIGSLPQPILLKKGQRVLMAQDFHAGGRVIPFDFTGDIRAIKKRLPVFIDDGNIMLEVMGHQGNRLRLEVVFGGVLKERKGINIPGLQRETDILTPKDEADISFGVRHKVDCIAQSFVRNKRDIERVTALVKPQLPECKIIAKIENRDGLRNIERIMDACDGIMIARGDLGVSVPIYKIPMIQKDIIRRCNKRRKFVITATQMLESMTERSRPTRAEVTDVANAILDGTNGVMLSAETASGRFPVRAVRMMSQITSFTERSMRRRTQKERS